MSLGSLLVMTIVYVLKSEARSDLDNVDVEIEVTMFSCFLNYFSLLFQNHISDILYPVVLGSGLLYLLLNGYLVKDWVRV